MIRQCRVPRWGINGGEGKWALMFPKDIEPFIWWLLIYPSPPSSIYPSFSTPCDSFAHFIFGEQEESPRVRVYLWFSREERILFEFSRFFIPSKFVSEEKLFQVWNFSHNFQTQSILSSNFKLFLSSNPMRHTFSSWIVKLIFTQISWNKSQNWMRHVFSWS